MCAKRSIFDKCDIMNLGSRVIISHYNYFLIIGKVEQRPKRSVIDDDNNDIKQVNMNDKK